MKKSVSIIVPVYKIEENFFRECLDSMTALKNDSVEILLIDDGSPDNCGVICDEYAEKDARVRVLHKENAGVSAARNDGIRLAQGEYITFVDADDFVDTAVLDEQIIRLQNDDCPVVVCGYYEQDKLGEKPTDAFEKSRVFETDEERIELCKMAFGFGFGQNQMKKSGFFAVWAKFYRGDFLKEHQLQFKKGMAFAEDELFAFQALAKSQKVRYSAARFYHYRLRKSSVCHIKKDPSFAEMELFYDTFKAAIDACEKPEAYMNAMSCRYFDNLILRSAARWEIGESAKKTFRIKRKALSAECKTPTYKAVIQQVHFHNYADLKSRIILLLFKCRIPGAFLLISMANKRFQKEQDTLF